MVIKYLCLGYFAETNPLAFFLCKFLSSARAKVGVEEQQEEQEPSRKFSKRMVLIVWNQNKMGNDQ